MSAAKSTTVRSVALKTAALCSVMMGMLIAATPFAESHNAYDVRTELSATRTIVLPEQALRRITHDEFDARWTGVPVRTAALKAPAVEARPAAAAPGAPAPVCRQAWPYASDCGTAGPKVRTIAIDRQADAGVIRRTSASAATRH